MKVNTKYDIGDIVWYISNNKVVSGEVTDVFIVVESETEISYNLDCGTTEFPESSLFSTKEELINTL